MFKSDREYLRRYGKFLVAEYEKCAAHGYVRPYTPMRYVSLAELKKIAKAFPSVVIDMGVVLNFNPFGDLFGLGKTKPKKGYKVFHIPIYRKNDFSGQSREWISKPGYYRVEKNGKTSPCFSAACANGIPIQSSLGRESHWEAAFNENWRDRVAFSRLRTANMKQKAAELEERRNALLRIPEKRESRQFFQAVAMASAVGG